MKRGFPRNKPKFPSRFLGLRVTFFLFFSFRLRQAPFHWFPRFADGAGAGGFPVAGAGASKSETNPRGTREADEHRSASHTLPFRGGDTLAGSRDSKREQSGGFG